MARNGSGTASLLAPLAVANTVSSSTTVNATMDDVAEMLTDSINVDGTKAWEANQSLGGFKLTSMGAGSARGDNINLGQAQDGKANWVAAGGTADIITATYSPAITALVDGQECCVRASGANTVTTPSFTPNSGVVTARTIVKNGGSALAVGDIPGADYEMRLRYKLADTRWELQNPAIPAGLAAASTTDTLTGTNTAKYVTPDAQAALWEKGADTASAGTTAIGEGGYLHITGTTTITDIDFSTAKDGRGVKVVFDGILTLTHNGTTLVLPGGQNIVTAAGDTAEFIQDSSDNIKCLWYQRASGKPLVASITQATEQATTSGTSIDFTGIPAGVKRITVMLNEVSSNGTSTWLIQLGDSGGIETGSYISFAEPNGVTGTSTSGFLIASSVSASNTYTGVITLTLMNGSNTWVASGILTSSGGNGVFKSTGIKATSATLDRVRFTTSNGTDTFDAGAINIMYE